VGNVVPKSEFTFRLRSDPNGTADVLMPLQFNGDHLVVEDRGRHNAQKVPGALDRQNLVGGEEPHFFRLHPRPADAAELSVLRNARSMFQGMLRVRLTVRPIELGKALTPSSQRPVPS